MTHNRGFVYFLLTLSVFTLLLNGASAESETRVKAPELTLSEPATATGTLTDADQVNQTLTRRNTTNQIIENQTYYKSIITYDEGKAKYYWKDMEKEKNATLIEISSYDDNQDDAVVPLSFDFPFYGYSIRKITVLPSGFLFTGNNPPARLAVRQYIAPLSANYKLTSPSTSRLKFFDNGTAFTVEWENLILPQVPENVSYTFQCTLFRTGDIVFVYRHVGVPVKDIQNDRDDLRAGVSDAYVYYRTINSKRRKRVREYHRVDLRQQDIGNWTLIELKALPTCLTFSNCTSCLVMSPKAGLQCHWCADRCSSGKDRFYQDWLDRGCHRQWHTMSVRECSSSFERSRRL